MEENVVVSPRLTYAYKEKHPGHFSKYELIDGGVVIHTKNGCALGIYLLSEKIIRFRYSVTSHFLADFSYATDPNLKLDNPQFEVLEEFDNLIIETKFNRIVVSKIQLFVAIYDDKGELISRDEKGFHWQDDERHGGEIVKMSKFVKSAERLYGLGDKTHLQNIRGHRYTNWGTDEFGYKGDSDPLYKNINLIYGKTEDHAYGIFFDNSFKSYFDLAKERKDILSFWADGGEMNYYFLLGKNLLDVASQYARLTGTAELPPLWALGYQQCKWSYYPESQVRSIAQRMREEQIPCDAIYLDIDYMDGFRCFTWNKEHFPDPKGMVADLKAKGFKTVAIIDPGIKIDYDYEIFTDGLKEDVYCKRSEGAYIQGKVWPGECYFPDFTNPRVREWWSGLFQDLIGNIGLAGIWNDMNEPAIFDVPSKTFPLDVRHNYDGHPCSHRKAHNVYGMQMSRATLEGVKKYNGGKRPLIITRSGYAGMQRYTSTWTGDNLASWEHLFIAHMQTLRLSISGVSFCGSDIGGFIDQPDGELYVRWMQLAIFHPFFRTHSSGDHGDQEPWSFGKTYLKYVKKAIETRYRLLPYMYTCFYQYHAKGLPILRPFDFMIEDVTLDHNDEAGFLGDHMFYAPVFKQGEICKDVYLPEGQWYDYEDHKLYDGGQNHLIATPLSKSPVFVRSGAVLPHFPLMQYVNPDEINKLILRIYIGRQEVVSEFYIDELDGFGYKEEQFRLSRFTTRLTNKTFTIEQSISGTFNPQFEKYTIQIIGLSGSEPSIQIDDQNSTEFYFVSANKIELAGSIDFKKILVHL